VLALMPIAALNLPTSNSVFLLALVAMALIWLRHFDNIIRLIKGKEPRIGAKSA
jgi:glycerol-3-phosphate acyltransferase PlsY